MLAPVFRLPVNFMDNDIQPCEELKNLWCDWSGTTRKPSRGPAQERVISKNQFCRQGIFSDIPDGTWPRFFTSIARCPTD